MPVLDLLPALEGERHAGDLPELPLAGIRALVARALAARGGIGLAESLVRALAHGQEG